MSEKLREKESEYGCLQDLVLEIERFCKNIEPVIDRSIKKLCDIYPTHRVCKERFSHETR